MSSHGRCGVEIARETEEGCKGRIEGLEGKEEGIGKMEERRGEKGAGNREENKERGKEGHGGGEGRAERGGYVGSVRREGHKKLEAILEAARMERKREKAAQGRSD